MCLWLCVCACLYNLHIYLERRDSNANDLISSVSRNYLLRFTQGKGKTKAKRQKTKAKAEAWEHKQQLGAEAQAEDEHTAKEKKNQ